MILPINSWEWNPQGIISLICSTLGLEVIHAGRFIVLGITILGYFRLDKG